METKPAKPPITVGVDEGAETMIALRWAAEEAAAASRPLVLVHALEWLPQARIGRDDYYFPLGDEGADKTVREAYEARAKEMLAAAEAVVTDGGSGASVTTKLIEGSPFDVLTAEGRDSSMLVLGSHGRGLLGRMLLGSVSTAIGSDPPCPVAIVRAHSRAIPIEASDIPVVVGFDGTATSRDALTYAADHAAARGAALVVVHAFRPVDQRTAGSISEQASRRTTWLRDSVAAVEKGHPDLTVTCTVTDHRPAQSLVDWSATARLVVIGTGARRAHIGSVGQALLHHSWAPVVVIPEP